MATIRNLLIRIGVTDERVSAGVKRVNRQLDSLSDRINHLEKVGGAGKFAALAGTILRLGHSFAPAVGSMGQLASAAAPAAGAVLAIPAAFAVAKAGMAVFKVGITGVGEAMKAVAGGDAKKLKESLKNLAPTARQFVVEMGRARKAFDPVRRAVQQRLFAGLAAQVRQVAQRALPGLRTGMTATASQMNGLARSALSAARTPLFSGVMRQVLMTTAAVLRAFRPAVQPLIIGLARLVQVGLPLVRLFGEWAGRMATTGARMLASERTAKRMAAAVDRASAVFKRNGDAAGALRSATAELRFIWSHLTRIGHNVSRTIEAVGRAMSMSTAPATSMLDMITQLTLRMNDWSNSAQGQEQLRTLFSSLQQVSQNLMQILPALGGVLTMILQVINGMPGPVRNVALQFLAWSIVLGRLTGPLGLAAKLTVGLGRAGVGLGRQLGSSDSKLRTFISKVGDMGRAAGRAAASFARATASMVVSMARAAATAAMVALRVVAGWVLMGAQALLQAARVALAWIIAMGPIALVIAAVIAIVVLIIKNWDTIKRVTVAVWNAVWRFISGIVRAVVGFVRDHWRLLITIFLGPFGLLVALTTKYWRQIWAFIQGAVRGVIAAVNWLAALPGRVAGWFVSMARGAVNATGAMLRYVAGVPGAIFRLFAGAGKWLVNAGKSILIGLWNGIASLGGWLARSLMNLVKRIIPGPVLRVLGIHSPSRVMARIGAYAGEGLAQGLLGTARLVERASTSLAMSAIPGSPAFAGATPGGVRASAGTARPVAGGGLDPRALAAAMASALQGLGVEMDGQQVGQLVSRRLGRATEQRRRTG